MNILSTIIPGFRSLRAPVAAGIMWLSFGVILVALDYRHFHFDTSAFTTLGKVLPDWFGAVALPTIIAVSYVVGSVIVGITTSVERWIGKRIRRAIVKLRKKDVFSNSRMRRLLYLAEHRSRSISILARGLVIDAVMNKLTDAGAPSTAAMIFPVDTILDALPLAAIQLSQLAPSQFQEVYAKPRRVRK